MSLLAANYRLLLQFSSDGPLAHQGDSIKVVLGLYMRFMRASRLAVDDEGERLENSIRNAMGAISGLSFAVEREGHATDGLGIAAAVTAPIPIVGLFVSLAATAAAVGTGIAGEVRGKELAEMTETIRERIKEACGWSCIEHLASSCEAYVADKNSHRSCAQPMEQLWQYLLDTGSDSCSIEEDVLLNTGLQNIQKLHQIVNSDESGALEGICIDGQWSVDAGQIRFVNSGGVQMISSILGLQLVIHTRALLNAAIQGSLYSTMASVGLLDQMNRSQRFVAFLGRSTNGATHGIGRISAILGVLVIIMAGLSIDMRAKRPEYPDVSQVW